VVVAKIKEKMLIFNECKGWKKKLKKRIQVVKELDWHHQYFFQSMFVHSISTHSLLFCALSLLALLLGIFI